MSLKLHGVSEDTLKQIASAIAEIRFGCVQITVHNAQVVEIETRQKIRVDRPAYLSPGGQIRHPSLADQATGGKQPVAAQPGHAFGVSTPGR